MNKPIKAMFSVVFYHFCWAVWSPAVVAVVKVAAEVVSLQLATKYSTNS